MSKVSDIPKLTKTFLFSAIDHATNDVRVQYPFVRSNFEAWKQSHTDQHAKEQAIEEEYIIQFANRRSEYEHAYKEWVSSRNTILTRMKQTSVIGEQEKYMIELLRIPFPDVLKTPVEDVYTRHRQS